MFGTLGTATGLVLLECSTSNTSVSIPCATSLRRRKPCSARIGVCTNLHPSTSIFRCPAWSYQASDSRWTSDVSTVQASAASATLAEAWVASEEATVLAAAAEAMALARAALLAAKEAADASAEEVDVSRYDLMMLRACPEFATTSREQLEEVLEPEVSSEDSCLEKLAVSTEDVSEVDIAEPLDIAVSSTKRRQRLLKRQQRAETRRKALSQEVEEEEVETPLLLAKGGPRVTTTKDRYCQHMARRCRMTVAEELEAIYGIQEQKKMNDLKAGMTEQLGREPTSREWAEGLKMDVRDLHKKLAHVKKCRDVMVASNLGLVIKVAKRFSMKNNNTEDLVQEGVNGLLHGVEKFDTSRGFRLSTYVLWWIELFVRRACVQRSILTQVPMHMFDTYTRVMKTRAIVCEERGTCPSNQEVAKLIGTSVQKVNLVANLMRPPRSLEAKLPGCENVTMSEILADPNVESPFMAIERKLLKQQIENILNKLKPREKQILCLRYGLQDGRERTLEELSHYFDLSRERVRQIEKRAMTKINELGGKEALASFAQTFLKQSHL